MIKILYSYFKKQRKYILLFLVFVGIFSFVFYLYGIRQEAVSYAFLLSFTAGGAAACFDFFQYYKKCRLLQRVSDSISSGLTEFPKALDISEKAYQQLVQMLWKEKEELSSAVSIGRQEMLDYYSLWVHQIKTPIAAMKLLLQSMEDTADEGELGDVPQKVQPLKMELFKTEQYVEMVLAYLRMGNMSADMMLQWYSVADIVRQVVRKYSQLFILKKIKLEFIENEDMVLTDEKWLVFVLEQILSNALKYTKAGTISIYMSDEKQKLS